MRQCPLDGAEIPDDREICPATEGAMRGQLRAVPELLDELDTSLARIGSSWRGDGLGRGGSGTCRMVEGDDGRLHPCLHEPDSPTCTQGAQLVLNTAASEASLQLRTVLHGWARVWDEETPLAEGGTLGREGGERQATTPGTGLASQPVGADALPVSPRKARRERDHALGTAARQAVLLAGQHLAGRPWAPDLARELRAAVRQAEHAIDRAPELQLAGTCTCGMAVYAEPGQRQARCRWCGALHDPAALYDAMIAARGALYTAPAAVIARMVVDVLTGKPLMTAAQIRGWKFRGDLAVHHVNESGQPEYVIADVVELAKRPPADVAAEPA